MNQSMKIQGTRATQSKVLLNEVVLRTHGTKGETFWGYLKIEINVEPRFENVKISEPDDASYLEFIR